MKKIVYAGGHEAPYRAVFRDVSKIIDTARSSAARSVNAAMTTAYWLIGLRIVEFEQSGQERAEYGTALIERLAADLTQRFGRGFSRQNIQNMRQFYLSYPPEQIRQTQSGESEATPYDMLSEELLTAFPLPWSAYVRLLPVKNVHARRFYETEALRGGWSIRQLGRQINSQFYERTALSKNKAAMLTSAQREHPEDLVLPSEAIKDPFILEFLDLKDEALARYALDGLPNNVLAAEYRIALPDEELLADELDRTRQAIELRGSATFKAPTMSVELLVRKPEEQATQREGREDNSSKGS